MYWQRGLRAKLDNYAAGVDTAEAEAEAVDQEQDDNADELAAEQEIEPIFAGSRPVVTFDYRAWRWFHGLGMEALLLRVIELAATYDEVPALVVTLARRLRAPGAVLAGIREAS